MNKLLRQQVQLVYFLKQTLPSTYDVFLFDLTKKSCPVIAQTADNEFAIKLSRQFVLSAAKDDATRERGMLLNQMLTVETSHMIRASVYFISDAKQEIVGALCLNTQCNTYLQLQGILSSVLRFDNVEQQPNTQEEIFKETTPGEKPGLDLIDREIAAFSVEPLRMTQGEREEIICDLYETGVFSVKGAVAHAAQVMGVSEQSVYRYIAKIKRVRNIK